MRQQPSSNRSRAHLSMLFAAALTVPAACGWFGQEEYVNPFTGQVETGTDQWRHRWINERGDVIYTDRESYDPNTDIRLAISGFKRSPIRPRGPR